MAVVNTEADSWKFSYGQGAFMRARGIEYHCFSSAGPPLDYFAETEGVVAHPLEISRTITVWRDLRAVFQLAAAFRRIGAQMVMGETAKSGLLAMLAGWMAGTPVRIYRNHGMALCSARGFRRILLWVCERVSCALAHRVIYVAPTVQDEAIRLRVCPPGKAATVLSANGLDAENRFNPALIEAGVRESVRSHHGIPAGAPVLGYVGRLFRVKGTAQLTEAWTALSELYPEIHLLIAGEFDVRDPLSDSVKQFLRNQPRIHLAGYVEDVRPLLRAMDMLILPSFHEGLGYTLLEGAAMELPVIATRIPGSVNALRGGVTGTLIEPGSVSDIVRAVCRYVDDPALRRAHGRNGRRFIKEAFNQRRVWERLYAEFAGIADSRNVPLATHD